MEGEGALDPRDESRRVAVVGDAALRRGDVRLARGDVGEPAPEAAELPGQRVGPLVGLLRQAAQDLPVRGAAGDEPVVGVGRGEERAVPEVVPREGVAVGHRLRLRRGRRLRLRRGLRRVRGLQLLGDDDRAEGGVAVGQVRDRARQVGHPAAARRRELLAQGHLALVGHEDELLGHLRVGHLAVARVRPVDRRGGHEPHRALHVDPALVLVVEAPEGEVAVPGAEGRVVGGVLGLRRHLAAHRRRRGRCCSPTGSRASRTAPAGRSSATASTARSRAAGWPPRRASRRRGSSRSCTSRCSSRAGWPTPRRSTTRTGSPSGSGCSAACPRRRTASGGSSSRRSRSRRRSCRSRCRSGSRRGRSASRSGGPSRARRRGPR